MVLSLRVQFFKKTIEKVLQGAKGTINFIDIVVTGRNKISILKI